VSLSPQFLDELRMRTSLSALIGRTVPLKKAGQEHKGCCPFHSEKTPSFHVIDGKQFYHCFGCGAHGDAIRWLTDHQGMQFMDAVKELAQAAGMDVPAADPRQAERDREYGELRDVMGRAARWFASMLHDDRHGGLGAQYAAERMPSWAVADFEVGYAPRGRGVPRLLEHLADVPLDRLVQLGLVKRKDDGEIYDAFRGRLMFPIHDTRGRVIGFGGRIIGAGEPKYLNSPDTPLFDKGRILFNAHRAAPAARKASRLIIVEGYMDVVALGRADIHEAVAPNGTALTEAQISAAWRMADNPILCMDGDKAGRAAMARAALRALPMLEPGKSLMFTTPPAGQDPDDLLREGGPEAVQALFLKPQPLVDVLWAHERDAEPCDTPEQVAGLKARMRQHVKAIRNDDVRAAYGQEFAKRFRSTFDAQAEGVMATSGPQIRSRPTERPLFRRNAAPKPASDDQRQIGREGIASDIERAVLIGLLRFPDLLQAMRGVAFRSSRITAIVDRLVEYAFLNDIQTEAQMETQITALGMADEIAAATAGRSLPFSYARSISTPSARADLAATLQAMTRR